MEIEKRALYNLIRMNSPAEEIEGLEQWQVEDYRSLPTKQLLSRLHHLGIALDQSTFSAYSEDVDNPEDLTDLLLDDLEIHPKKQDQIYLLIFELWRRLLPERFCLTIFCDELDQQIYLYDHGRTSKLEAIQDAIANLQMIMDEYVDHGSSPLEVMDIVSSTCANHLETFFYDYITEQVDEENLAYATDLIEGFSSYFKGNKWFELINIRIGGIVDSTTSHEELKKIVLKAVKDQDLAFNLELLSIIVQFGEKEEFNKMVRKTVPLIQSEEDFLDLLCICNDYYRCLDEEQKETQIQQIIDTRQRKKPEDSIDPADQDIAKLLKILR